jgi:hypothetical protein
MAIASATSRVVSAGRVGAFWVCRRDGIKTRSGKGFGFSDISLAHFLVSKRDALIVVEVIWFDLVLARDCELVLDDFHHIVFVGIEDCLGQLMEQLEDGVCLFGGPM